MKDGHVHSHYCLHGSDDTFQMYIENAIKAGIDEISFTEHFLQMITKEYFHSNS